MRESQPGERSPWLLPFAAHPSITRRHSPTSRNGRCLDDAAASIASCVREPQWFWWITEYVEPRSGLRTSGMTETLDAAKTAFQAVASVVSQNRIRL